MPLRLSCPHCREGISLSEPYPLAGDPIACASCGKRMAVSYPAGVQERLIERGKQFRSAARPTGGPASPVAATSSKATEAEPPSPRDTARRDASPPVFPDDASWFGPKRTARQSTPAAPAGAAPAGVAPTGAAPAGVAPAGAAPAERTDPYAAASEGPTPPATAPRRPAPARPNPARPTRATEPRPEAAEVKPRSGNAERAGVPERPPAPLPPPPSSAARQSAPLLTPEEAQRSTAAPFDASPFAARAATPPRHPTLLPDASDDDDDPDAQATTLFTLPSREQIERFEEPGTDPGRSAGRPAPQLRPPLDRSPPSAADRTEALAAGEPSAPQAEPHRPEAAPPDTRPVAPVSVAPQALTAPPVPAPPAPTAPAAPAPLAPEQAAAADADPDDTAQPAPIPPAGPVLVPRAAPAAPPKPRAAPSTFSPAPASGPEAPEPAPRPTRAEQARAARTTPTGAAFAPTTASSGPPSRGRTLRNVALGLIALGVLSVPAAYYGLQAWFGDELPSVEKLRAYEPATVTTVHASDGTLLGEIYEERRYVLPLDQIPQVVIDAFIAAEDANFWNHGGIDYMGIARAMGRNLAAGRVSQGGSTITQQVAKTFLLSSDRRIERKVKEAFLSWRTEAAYSKEHILYLYLNQIFLGSQAYGVEAAARTFFGKHVNELTLAEAAMIAGLPPRPSNWNPHADFAAATNRQHYVLGQMVINGMITQADADAAKAETITVVARGNTFLEQAPHFTEYARRYLVERYGEDRVLNEGLSVTTTCDLRLQQIAQNAVSSQVHHIDQRMGFRREGLVRLLTEAERNARIDAQESAMRQAWAREQDPTGRTPPPERSVLVPGKLYEGVITEVDKTWFRVRIGAHEGLVPVAWADWAYVPDDNRSWLYRSQDDFTRPVKLEGEDGKQGGIVRVGDVAQFRVEALSTTDPSVSKAFQKTPGAGTSLVALKLWQTPEVESALLSLDIATGAVRAMVGGADFGRSQFNRAVQSYRQVGSTFKPIVYAAALSTRKLTTASLVPDAPLAFANTLDNGIWKPSNYGDDYLGNITMRKALAMSRNTCTVRILDIVDPGMVTGVVYDFTRALGIGGPPTHLLPEGYIRTPENDHLCPWVPETDKMRSCPDRHPAISEEVSREEHLQNLRSGAKHLCRVCDLSIALGSASLTMEELVGAYAVFPRGGDYLPPYYVEEVRDRRGEVLERHRPEPATSVMAPGVASASVWLLENVVQGGTASAAGALGVHLGGKTGTTNDEMDAWFVGFSPDVITAVWVGFDERRTLGPSSTGGRTALPIWIEYMKEAAPKSKDRPFPMRDISWASIDEDTGHRVQSGGRSYPFLPGTEPASSGYDAGQASLEDLTTEF